MCIRDRTTASNSVKVDKDVIQVDTTELFQRILCTVHSPDDLRDCFKYELATVPTSLFYSSGLMRKTKNSSVYNLLDRVPEQIIEINDEFFIVVVGGFLINHVVWPQTHVLMFTRHSSPTFEDIIRTKLQ